MFRHGASVCSLQERERKTRTKLTRVSAGIAQVVVTTTKQQPDLVGSAGRLLPLTRVTLDAITLRAAFHFFKSAVQLRITVGGAAFVSPTSVPIRNL